MDQSGIAIVPPQNCASLEVMESRMATQFGEVRRGAGIMSTGNLAELLVSDAGTWTIVTISPLGVACLSLSGRDWSETTVLEGEQS